MWPESGKPAEHRQDKGGLKIKSLVVWLSNFSKESSPRGLDSGYTVESPAECNSAIQLSALSDL